MPPAGTWEKPRAHVFALAEQVLPANPPVDDDVAKLQLVPRYLSAFGPASAADAASFTGLPIGAVRVALTRLELRRFRTETGTELVDLRDAPLPPAATPGPSASWAPGTRPCSCTRAVTQPSRSSRESATSGGIDSANSCRLAG